MSETPEVPEFDIAVLACRPVVPTNQEIAIALEAGMDIFTPYPNSVEATCAVCGREVFLGPRQQAMAKEYPETRVVVTCLTCPALLSKDASDLPIVSLGSLHPTDHVQEE